jgi:hypothetical protein
MQFDGGLHEWEAKKAFKWTLMPKGLAEMSLEEKVKGDIPSVPNVD